MVGYTETASVHTSAVTIPPYTPIKAVMLDQHGPNIVFPATIDPQEVIAFIERNWDLSRKTGGYQLSGAV